MAIPSGGPSFASLPGRADLPGHEVVNQPAAAGDRDLWAGDRAFAAMVAATGGDRGHLAARGRALGRAELRRAGREAMRVAPDLRLFDAGGRRLDEVVFHPAYHRLMAEGIGAGYAALPWDGAAGGHVSHAALVYLHSQVEPGTCCPMTMSYAAVPALMAEPRLAAAWRPKLLSRHYDAAVGAAWRQARRDAGHGDDRKAGRLGPARHRDAGAARRRRLPAERPQVVLLGADVGRLPDAGAGAGRADLLSGAALAPEGARNAVTILRLKDKLGNRANASAEIEYHGALAHRLGDEGAGLRMILTMVHHTRLDTAMAPAGLMRAALAEAHHWVQPPQRLSAPADRPAADGDAFSPIWRSTGRRRWRWRFAPRKPSTRARGPLRGSSWRWRNFSTTSSARRSSPKRWR